MDTYHVLLIPGEFSLSDYNRAIRLPNIISKFPPNLDNYFLLTSIASSASVWGLTLLIRIRNSSSLIFLFLVTHVYLIQAAALLHCTPGKHNNLILRAT